MLGNYFAGSLDMFKGLGNVLMLGLYTASSEGGGLQSL